MRNRNFWKLALGLGLLSVPFAGGCLQENSSQPTAANTGALTASVEPVVYQANAGAEALPNEAAAVEKGLPEAPALTNLVEAKIQPVSTNQPVPANVTLSPAAAELAKLAGSGVDQGVMLAYVTNSQSTFNLTAEEIIYLNDLGVPGTVVTAMIQRDQVLKEQGKNALLSSSTPVTNLPAPVPAEAGPAPTAVAQDYPTEPPPAPPAEEPTYATFYDSLAPYGTWVYVSGYGRCWRPTAVVVNPTWQPYFDGGHWVYTDCGWYWMSDYSWGWAPFHYGRWFRHNHWGWCWAPDVVWGSSWVSWRYSDAYCGWAPLPPGAYFSFGIGLTWYGHRAHDWDDFGLHGDHYRFVAWRHFDNHRVHAYGVPRHEVNNIYRNSVAVNRITVNNNTVINQGIPRERVATETRHTIKPVTVRSTSGNDRPATGRGERLSGNTLTVYRPAIPQRDQTAGTRSGMAGRQARSGVNAGGSAASSLSAPLAERASGTRARNGNAVGRDTSIRETAAPNRSTARPSRNQPPTVVNNSAIAQDPPARTATAPAGGSATRPSTGRQTTSAAAVTQGTANRPSAPVRSQATAPSNNRSSVTGGSPQQSTPSAPRTMTAPSAPTFRNADPNSRFERAQPRGTENNTRIYSTPAPTYQQPPRSTPTPTYTAPSRPAPSYSAPARAVEVPRYSPSPAPQRSYTPTPSYSRPESAPTRSYSAPAPSAPRSDSTPARSYSPPPSAPRSDPAPARTAPSSDSGGNRNSRSR